MVKLMLGNTEITSGIKLGTIDAKVYLGDTLLLDSTAPTPPTGKVFIVHNGAYVTRNGAYLVKSA